jgi:hypothetical protein
MPVFEVDLAAVSCVLSLCSELPPAVECAVLVLAGSGDSSGFGARGLCELELRCFSDGRCEHFTSVSAVASLLVDPVLAVTVPSGRAGRTKLAESPNLAYSCSRPCKGRAKKNCQEGRE